MTSNITAANSVAAADPATPAAANAGAWATHACDRYIDLALDFAWWFLFAALAIGTIGAIVMVVNSIARPAPAGNEAGGTTLQQAADAIKGLIEAFSKAPTWLAMMGGALFLLWMASDAITTCNGLANSNGQDGNGSRSAGSAEQNVSRVTAPGSGAGNSAGEKGGAGTARR